MANSIEFQPVDPDYQQRVRTRSFARQGVMASMGATLSDVSPGYCEIRLPYRPELSQQNGFFHAGATGTIADSAGGYAGYTLMPAESDVLTVEYKMNLLAPAAGDELVARGEVVRAGRTLIIARVDVDIPRGGGTRQCATLLQTLICVHRSGP